jgi:cytoskeletal protein RodZ
VVVLALLAVATVNVEIGAATPGAAPDPHPDAQGSAAKRSAVKPAPDPYAPQAPVTREPQQRSSPATTTSTSSATYDSTSTRTQGPATTTPAQRTQPQTKTTKTKTTKTTEPSTGQRVLNTPRRTAPAAVAASSLEGRPLLFGALGLVALALASGSLLFLVSRTGGWETRS